MNPAIDKSHKTIYRLVIAGELRVEKVKPDPLNLLVNTNAGSKQNKRALPAYCFANSRERSFFLYGGKGEKSVEHCGI
jgi:hypothetical protein